jgi:hypothetical protein
MTPPNPPTSFDDLREWLALAIAFAAVLVAPFIQANIANRDRRARNDELLSSLAAQREQTERQIFASVRSSNRQAWIDALRNDVAFYINMSQRLAHLRSNGEEPSFDMQFEASKAFTAIELRLNPNEATHQDLLARLEHLGTLGVYNPEQFRKAREEVVTKAQEIFKHEWNRVKRGE